MSVAALRAALAAWAAAHPEETFGTGLSAEGAHAALGAALAALSDAALAALPPGEPWKTATFVAARGAFTAPLEWVAVLLARGTAVTWKHPAGDPGLAPLVGAAAEALGLPLRITADRALDGELIVAMGSDAGVAAVRAAAPPTSRFLGFGHRFSVAWIVGADPTDDALVPEGFRGSWGSVAADAALHDGRGCLSPVAVFTPGTRMAACAALASALERAQARWPVGAISDGEAARIRSRRAAARVGGTVAASAASAALGLPPAQFEPVGLPRTLAVHQVRDAAAAAEVLAPYASALSTVGTDDPASAAVFEALGARVCRIGRMQRPPLARRHDGVDWLAATVRPTPT